VLCCRGCRHTHQHEHHQHNYHHHHHYGDAAEVELVAVLRSIKEEAVGCMRAMRGGCLCVTDAVAFCIVIIIVRIIWGTL